MRVPILKLKAGMHVGLPGDASGRQWVTLTEVERNPAYRNLRILHFRYQPPRKYAYTAGADGLCAGTYSARIDDAPVPVRVLKA